MFTKHFQVPKKLEKSSPAVLGYDLCRGNNGKTYPLKQPNRRFLEFLVSEVFHVQKNPSTFDFGFVLFNVIFCSLVHHVAPQF